MRTEFRADGNTAFTAVSAIEMSMGAVELDAFRVWTQLLQEITVSTGEGVNTREDRQ
jgi:hypothetical protein